MIDISKETLEKIKKEGVHPKPRWYFLTKNYFFWLMFALTTILGGMAFGMIMFLAGDLDWDIYHYLGISLPKAILMSLPYLWIILLLLFLFITYYNFIHTRTGYRYRFVMIFFIGLFLSGLMGLGFYQYGWTETVDKQLRMRMPGYHHLVYSRESQWMHPEKGLLSGIIVKIKTEEKMIWLEDELGNQWNIDISQARFKGVSSIEQNMPIRIIGKKLSSNSFQAIEIRGDKGLKLGPGRRKMIKSN